MATQDMMGLFGATPEEIRRQRMQQEMQTPALSTDPRAFIAQVGTGMGTQLAGLARDVGGMFGFRSAEEEQAMKEQEALKEAQKEGLSGAALYRRLAEISSDPRRAFALSEMAKQQEAAEAKASQEQKLNALKYRELQLKVKAAEQDFANKPDALQRFQKLVALNEGTGKYTTDQLAVFANDPKETENAVKELMKRPEPIKLSSKQAVAAKSLGLPVLNNINEYSPDDAKKIREAVFKKDKEIAEAGGQKQLSAYAKKVGEDLAEKDMTLIEQVQKAPATVRKLHTVLDLLEKGDINTGFAASLKTKLEAAIVQFTKDKEMGKRVADTQYLETLLGGDVFPLIGALGIGARGLDTPAERDFLLKVMTGEIGLSKETLIEMTKYRLQAVEDSVADFNAKVEGKEYFKDFLEVAPNRRSLIKKITIPVRPITAPPPAQPTTAPAVVKRDGFSMKKIEPAKQGN